MKKIELKIFLFVVFWLAAFSFQGCANVAPGQAPDAEADNAVYKVSFTPQETQAEIIDLIRNARQSIYVALYGFANEDIHEALVEVWHKRGTDKSLAWAKAHNKVKIDMVTEYDSEHEESWAHLIHEGLPLHLRNDSGIMHNKYWIIDEKYIVTGSTNLTEGMQHHFNNMVFLKSPDLASDFLRDYVVLRNGVRSTQKDELFVELFDSGAGADEELATADDTSPGPFYGEKVRCDADIDGSGGLTAQQCARIVDGSLSWQDLSLTEEQWSAIHSSLNNPSVGLVRTMGLERPLYTDSHYQTFKGAWPLKRRRVGLYGVEAYFTPYRESYSNYLYESGSAGGRDYTYMDYDDGLLQVRNYENAMNIVIPLIEQATESVTIYSFAFTDQVIMDRLIKAHEQRGVIVKVFMDYRMFRSTYQHFRFSFRELAKRVDSVKVTRKPDGGLLHHKVIMIDDSILVFGSLNFSNNAVTSNDENFLVVRNAEGLVDSFKGEASRITKYSTDLLDLEDFSGAYDPDDDEIAPFLPY